MTSDSSQRPQGQGETTDLPVNLIYIPDGHKMRFDPRDDFNRQFVDNIDRVGLLHHIIVRSVGDKYELVCGRRRLWAVKQLKHEMIWARIVELLPDEVQYFMISENLYRRNYTKTQRLKLVVELRKVYDEIFGKDPMRKIAAASACETAKRTDSSPASRPPPNPCRESAM